MAQLVCVCVGGGCVCSTLYCKCCICCFQFWKTQQFRNKDLAAVPTVVNQEVDGRQLKPSDDVTQADSAGLDVITLLIHNYLHN